MRTEKKRTRCVGTKRSRRPTTHPFDLGQGEQRLGKSVPREKQSFWNADKKHADFWDEGKRRIGKSQKKTWKAQRVEKKEGMRIFKNSGSMGVRIYQHIGVS